MKIAMISYWSCPLTKLGEWKAGGMNVYILNLADQIGKLGHEVDIYTHNHSQSHEHISKLSANARIIHLYRMEKDVYQGTKNFSHALYSFIIRNRLKYDYFHAHYYLSGLVGLELRKKIKIPLITTLHSLAVMKNKYTQAVDNQRIKTEIQLIDQSSALIASSDTEKRDIIRYYKGEKQKIYVAPPGVNHILFRPHNNQKSRKKLRLHRNAKIVLFVGRIDPIKGINTLIQAIPMLISDMRLINSLCVLIVGGDIKNKTFWKQEELHTVENIIQQKSLNTYIHFIGSQPHHLLPFYYSAADVVVVPSSYETFGLVALEAMACGASVVATSTGGLEYLISDTINGRLVKNQNAAHLAHVVKEILLDEKKREFLGENAQKTSQNYCWDKQAKRVISLYKKVI